MAIYNDDKKVCQFHVGRVDNFFWWTKEKELLIVNLENIYLNYFEKKFNKYDDIKLNIRNPLKSERVLFNCKKNLFLGKAKTKEEVKKIILTNCYFYRRK